MFLVEQDGLADDDVGVGEIDFQVALLGDGHAADENVELLGDHTWEVLS